ncbi:FtsX-like permease family protein [Flavobacteriaceae bacterium TP-CH-4]|uniref:FtsX-like permease family protein n=1 Tax=Pelagihabitans pacificus TaxID=2696054 RepID=A0A967E9D0_9FLAO|nr:ABC transporter permease [Pelagihabitans pacificus]NHF58351.1 FtsX-like permease family protein [Pelagihabitans pacificus]
MFDIERWQEIFDTIRKNKLRTFLTGLSVASGIFILVILLGFGQGMQNGIAQEFQRDASNMIGVYTQVTTKEYKGLNPGRVIQLRDENYEFVEKLHADKLEYKSPMYRVFDASITYGKESGAYSIWGTSPHFQQLENAFMSYGRFLNYKDSQEKAKVVVISNKIHRELMNGIENPIGEHIEISGLSFQIVGVYGDVGGEREEEKIYMPVSTAQGVYNGADRLNMMYFTLKPAETFEQSLAESTRFTEELKTYLKQVHTVAPDDLSAINTFNTLEEVKRFYNLTGGIRFFFWFVGICTIVAGIVGVSNVMLIIVKERTKEIGIRKALGAKPISVIGLILHEAIFVTAVFGFGGLIFSMGLLEIFGPMVEVDYVVNPSIDFRVALITVFLLILAGALAGFFPAYRAAKIKPIIALRDE